MRKHLTNALFINQLGLKHASMTLLSKRSIAENQSGLKHASMNLLSKRSIAKNQSGLKHASMNLLSKRSIAKNQSGLKHASMNLLSKQSVVNHPSSFSRLFTKSRSSISSLFRYKNGYKNQYSNWSPLIFIGSAFSTLSTIYCIKNDESESVNVSDTLPDHLDPSQSHISTVSHLPRLMGSSLQDIPDTFPGENKEQCDVSQIVIDVLDLYSNNPSEDILLRLYTPDVVFENPIMRLSGRKMTRAGMLGLTRLYSEATSLKWKVDLERNGTLVASSEPFEATEITLDNKSISDADRAIIIWSHQRYTMKLFQISFERVTAIRLYVDKSGRVYRHEDLWHGVELAEWKNTGILGGAAQLIRTINGIAYTFLFAILYDW